ncbi:24 kDa secreted protein, putative [Brugia malayi]|uniref:24 kDa secreted protein, putative n=2 Tax=Brugia malayi TaxID=6279 RepID=A0A4E9F8U1_BRUMA|nr:24 kDa secreted protein, putative [Brugia malayi]VIO90327.1 24 kDa secreted protein, putative [Brugia malayi]
MIRLIVSLIIVILFEKNYGQQTVRQCTCNEIEPCKKLAVESVLPCSDQCQKFVSSMGGNYQQIRSCFQQKQPIIDKAMQCSQDAFPEACSRTQPKMIPKRYTKGIEIAAMNEINKQLQRMGIAEQVTNLLSQGRRFFKCFQSCMTKKLGKCADGCHLDLPSDNVVVQKIKSCALRSGVQTAAMKDLCFCIERGGIRQLAGICPRIQIFETK